MTRLFLSASLLLVACSSNDPAATSGNGGSPEGTTSSSSASVTTGAGGMGGGPATTSSSSGGSVVDGGDGGDGDASTWGAGCGSCTYGGMYWWGSTCVCKITPAYPNCITADKNGTPATGCDDGNPCTQDVADPSAPDGCKHLWFGLGSSCGAPELLPVAMQCVVGGTGEQCCPVNLAHPTCTQEGVQAECDSTSVCLEGACWITCQTNADCIGAPGNTCKVVSVGHVSTNICL